MYFLDTVNYRLTKVFIPDRAVRSFWQSNDSALWIATTSGLARFSLNNRKVVRWWDESTGLPNSYVYSVLGDDKGYLWMSTNRGLCRMDTSGKSIRNFSINQGLQSMEFNTNAYCKLQDGRMLFGGVGGLNVVDPHSIPDSLPDIPIIPSDILRDGRTVDLNPAKRLSFPYENTRLVFQLQPLIWPDIESYTLSVRLEGQDMDWLPVGTAGRVSYTNLDPGNYVLHARVESTDGRIGGDQLILHLHIMRPWWKTIWFYVVTVLAIGVVAGGIVTLVMQARYRKKVRAAELRVAQESLRVQLARDIHDDLGAGLSKIALMSELGNAEESKTLPEIATAARDLVGRMSEIIWAMQPDSSTWEDLVIHFRSYGAEYLEHTEVLLDVTTQGDIPANELNPGQKRNLLLIYKEALRNVQQHANATRVRVCFHFQPESCWLIITDNGTGQRNQKSVMRGRGFENMCERAKLMGGWCKAGPVNEVGWEITVWIPYQTGKEDTTNWGKVDRDT